MHWGKESLRERAVLFIEARDCGQWRLQHVIRYRTGKKAGLLYFEETGRCAVSLLAPWSDGLRLPREQLVGMQDGIK